MAVSTLEKMLKRFATTITLNPTGQVLLMLREDFRIWGLPGGTLEPGESPEQAAIRETREETGYEVAIERYIGRYRRPALHDERFVYLARVVGGQAIDSGPETLQVSWCAPDDLPARSTPFLKQIVQDALQHTGEPFEQVQHVPVWQVIYFRLRIALRDYRNRRGAGCPACASRPFMNRIRSAGFLIQADQIALIERHRPAGVARRSHYFVFPGGGVEPGETPEAAVVREVEEELGLRVVVRRLAAERWINGSPEYYFLVEAVGGEFGAGQGEEYTQPQPPEVGTFQPVWMRVEDLTRQPVVPIAIAALVAPALAQAHPDAWPDQVFRIFETDAV